MSRTELATASLPLLAKGSDRFRKT